ncbi:hypothetical protein ANCCAN_25689, partial [Ancylostoma caninum]
FGEDIIGLRHDELKAGVVVNPEQSGSLGETTEQRVAVLTQLTKDRLSYRKELFRALQMALRDVRSYGYDVGRGRWIPNNRKCKRARLEASNPDSGEDE